MNLHCDFCHDETVTDDGKRTHHSKEFAITVVTSKGIIPIHFTEEWLACPSCDALIRANDETSLLRRAMKNMGDSPISVALIHRLFWKNRREI